jgi:hypothetical protein
MFKPALPRSVISTGPARPAPTDESASLASCDDPQQREARAQTHSHTCPSAAPVPMTAKQHSKTASNRPNSRGAQKQRRAVQGKQRQAQQWETHTRSEEGIGTGAGAGAACVGTDAGAAAPAPPAAALVSSGILPLALGPGFGTAGTIAFRSREYLHERARRR